MKSLRETPLVLTQIKGDSLKKLQIIGLFAVLTGFIVNFLLVRYTLLIRKQDDLFPASGALVLRFCEQFESWFPKVGQEILIIRGWFWRRIKVTSPLPTALPKLDKCYFGKIRSGFALGLYQECLLALNTGHSTEDPFSLHLNSKTSHCSRLRAASLLASYCTVTHMMDGKLFLLLSLNKK